MVITFSSEENPPKRINAIDVFEKATIHVIPRGKKKNHPFTDDLFPQS